MIFSIRVLSKTARGLPYSTYTSRPFPALCDTVSDSIHLTSVKEKSQDLLGQLKNINKICYDGGGERGRNVHLKKNRKVLPRQRVAELFDDGSDYLELSLQAGLGMPYGDVPGASTITGIGKINGYYCIVGASDATLKGGTSYPIGVTKSLRAFEVGAQCRMPQINLIDSGGAFLPLQSEIFPDKKHGGRSFYNLAVHSAQGIPQISLVCGSCTAGGAYIPKMSEDVAIVDRIGTVFLGGPPLVKAALGEVVTPEDLGGAKMHCSISGGTDYFCTTEDEGFAVVRDIVSTVFDEIPSTHEVESEPTYSISQLDDFCGLEYMDKSFVYGVIARITDASCFREFKKMYGKNLVTGYSLIGRRRVGIVANCGPLTYEDGLKGAHFIQICEHRRIPLIFLQNSGSKDVQSSFYTSLSDEDSTYAMKGRAAMMASLASSTAFKIAFNIGGCFGDDNYTMCGPSFNPNFLFCWPGASTSNSLAFQTEEIPKKVSKSAFNFHPHSCWYTSAHLINDGIIFPSETRKVLSTCLDIYHQREKTKKFDKSAAVYRF